MNYELKLNAGYYLSEGISVTLTDNNKVSIGPWKEFQKRFITDDEIDERISKAQGIAIICGAVSGGLEVIDIDIKYDITGTLWKRLQSAIDKNIFKKLTIAKTKSGGYHLYYRCSKIEGNQKIANRPATDEELKKNPHNKVMILIETRGEGGYVVAPPSAGYEFIQGDYTTIPILDQSDRESLFAICGSFNEYLEEPKPQERNDNFAISPIDDFNERGDVIELLTKHGWKSLGQRNGKTILRRPGKDEGHSGDYWHEKRWFSVFSTSTQFEPNKAYNPSAIFCILECANDWKKCTRELANLGYGKDSIYTKKYNNMISMVKNQRTKGRSDDDIEMLLINERKLRPAEARKLIEDSKKPSEKDGDFWEYNDKGKLRLIKAKLIDFLEAQGFCLMAYDKDGNDLRLVNIKDGIIEESSIEKVKKCLYEYCRTKNIEVAEYLVNHHQMVSESFLEFIKRINPSFLVDTPDSAYFQFKNYIIKVTSDSIVKLNYGDIKELIWKSSIIQHDVELVEDQYLNGTNISWIPDTDIFPEFVFLISGQDMYRFTASCSIIGYLLHKYKDYTRPYSIVLAEETDNEQKGGGTGKGIMVSAISKMSNTETVDGKNFRADKSFVWQRVKMDTRILAIQDIRKNIDFEAFYSIITEGITVEKKGQQEIYIPFETSPKIIFTTNHMINDLANHASRRLKVLPFSDFFGVHLTPQEHFKEQLFNGWDKGRYKLFYNFMFACVQLYLKHGVMDIQKTIGMQYKAIKSAFGDEFRQWIERYRNDSNGWIEFKELFAKFLIETDLSEKEFSRKRFRKALQVSAETFKDIIEFDNRGPVQALRINYITKAIEPKVEIQ